MTFGFILDYLARPQIKTVAYLDTASCALHESIRLLHEGSSLICGEGGLGNVEGKQEGVGILKEICEGLALDSINVGRRMPGALARAALEGAGGEEEEDGRTVDELADTVQREAQEAWAKLRDEALEEFAMLGAVEEVGEGRGELTQHQQAEEKPAAGGHLRLRGGGGSDDGDDDDEDKVREQEDPEDRVRREEEELDRLPTMRQMMDEEEIRINEGIGPYINKVRQLSPGIVPPCAPLADAHLPR